MAQTFQEIRRLLESAGARPNHKLGQNFLIDLNLLACVADAAQLEADSVVLEVGPGTGSLTEEILARLGPDGRVVACEHDRALFSLLQQRFAREPRLTLLHADALADLPQVLSRLPTADSRLPIADSQLPTSAPRLPTPAPRLPTPDSRLPILVSNLPYQIASPLLVELVTGPVAFARLAFTVQKEVAERISAPPEHPAYGPLGVILQAFASIERLRDLPPQAFWPAPQVHSSLVRLTPLSLEKRRESLGNSWNLLPLVVRHLLAYRRKTLAGTLKLLPSRSDLPSADWSAHLSQALSAAGISLTRRAETLQVEEFIAVTRHL